MKDRVSNNNLIRIIGDHDMVINTIPAEDEILQDNDKEIREICGRSKHIGNFTRNVKFENNNIFNFSESNSRPSLNFQKDITNDDNTESKYNYKSSLIYPKNSVLNNTDKQIYSENKDIRSSQLKNNDKFSSILVLNNNDEGKKNGMDTKDKFSKSKDNSKINILPYKTIDCIFNKKNIWINLQTPEADKIYYDIWDENKWYPLNFSNNKDDGNEKKPDSNVSFNKNSGMNEFFEGEESENQMKNYLINMEDIPAFYTFKDLINPFTEDDLKKLRNNIMNSIKYNITLYRKEFSLNTMIKNVMSI